MHDRMNKYRPPVLLQLQPVVEVIDAPKCSEPLDQTANWVCTYTRTTDGLTTGHICPLMICPAEVFIRDASLCLAESSGTYAVFWVSVLDKYSQLILQAICSYAAAVQMFVGFPCCSGSVAHKKAAEADKTQICWVLWSQTWSSLAPTCSQHTKKTVGCTLSSSAHLTGRSVNNNSQASPPGWMELVQKPHPFILYVSHGRERSIQFRNSLFSPWLNGS